MRLSKIYNICSKRVFIIGILLCVVSIIAFQLNIQSVWPALVYLGGAIFIVFAHVLAMQETKLRIREELLIIKEKYE